MRLRASDFSSLLAHLGFSLDLHIASCHSEFGYHSFSLFVRDYGIEWLSLSNFVFVIHSATLFSPFAMYLVSGLYY